MAGITLRLKWGAHLYYSSYIPGFANNWKTWTSVKLGLPSLEKKLKTAQLAERLADRKPVLSCQSRVKVESLSVCSFHFCDISHSQGTVESTVRVSSFIHMVLQNQGQETQFFIPRWL